MQEMKEFHKHNIEKKKPETHNYIFCMILYTSSKQVWKQAELINGVENQETVENREDV